MPRLLQTHVATYCQTLGNYWKPLETVAETVIKREETVETVNLIKENKGGLLSIMKLKVSTVSLRLITVSTTVSNGFQQFPKV